MALISAMQGLGALIGPILAGFLSDVTSWRLAFYINVPVCFLSFIMAWIGMKRFYIPRKSLELDYIGGLTITISNVSLILFLTWGGNNKYAWNSLQMIGLIIIYFLSLILFLLHEFFHTLPILQIRLHKIKNVSICYFIIFSIQYWTDTLINFAPIYFQGVLKDSALISGLKTLGFLVGFILMSIFAGPLIKTRKANILMGLAAGLSAISVMILSFILSKTLPFGYFFLLTMIMGAGIGYMLPASSTTVQNSISQRDVAVGMANYSFDACLGGILGITVAGTILTRYHLEKDDELLEGLSHIFFYLGIPCLICSFLGFFS